MKSKLLCCFVPETYLQNFLPKIQKLTCRDYPKVFVFKPETCTGSLAITYNGVRYTKAPYKSIPINRVKDTNTLFTLNALNFLNQNNFNRKVDWSKYQNCIITTSEGKIKVTKVKLKHIV